MDIGIRGKVFLRLIGGLAALTLAAGGSRARAEEPKYEKSDEFQKSKEDFGKEKPPVSVQLDQPKEKRPEPAPRKKETPAWLKGKTVGGWGGPTLNYPNLNMGIFNPLTEKRGLDGFKDVMCPVGGMGVGRIGPLRVGGMGLGWEQHKSHGDKNAAVSLGFGGLVLEVEGDVHPKVGIIGGAMLGGGSIHLSAEGPDVAGGSWDETESFLAAYPYLGLSVKVLPFLRLEANYGWLFFDYSPGGRDYVVGPGVKAVDGSLNGGGTGQVRLVFGYEIKMKEEK